MRVRDLLDKCIAELLKRGSEHDRSKLEQPEVGLLTEFTPKLAAVTYESAEYKEFRQKLKPALDHHYARNRHHPEFHRNGIKDMHLLDLVELLCDWTAASERHNDGNIRKSIEVNQQRFGYGDELKQILTNTVPILS
jgi:hypothetical protein